jgi:hypothetical protein
MLWLNNKTFRYNRFLLNSTEPEQVGIKQELINYKTQTTNYNVRLSAGLFGGNDQNQFFFGILDFFIKFVCYLEFIIWCLTGILKNFINKYFSKNCQKIFIKGLTGILIS